MGLVDELVASARKRARSLPHRPSPVLARGPSFIEALRGKENLDVIAEFKRASPSLGNIAERDLERQVRGYANAGASAISVLTEPLRFRGSYEDLDLAAKTVEIPVLMKDFVVDPAQVREAAHLGAQAVLLIVRCLSPAALDELTGACREYQLTPLVECHGAHELDRAVAVQDAVIGVNNRDLDTLELDHALASRLLSEIPEGRVAVAESGYGSAEDVQGVRGIADAVLIGSSLMKFDDPEATIREIRA